MADKQEMIRVRDEYIGLVKKELMGPGSEISIPDIEHELISDAPNTRYSVGVLFTKNTAIFSPLFAACNVSFKPMDAKSPSPW